MSKSKSIIKLVFSFFLFLSFICCGQTKKELQNTSLKTVAKTPLKIWFKSPTKKWNHGLPIGNGNLGAMIYGPPNREVICLNEETIWTGGRDYNRDKKDAGKYLDSIQQMLFDREYIAAEKVVEDKILIKATGKGEKTYQMLGNLFVQSNGLDSIINYRRELDINLSLIHI